MQLQFMPIDSHPPAMHHCKEPVSVFHNLVIGTVRLLLGLPPKPTLLQAEQAQLPQPLLTGQMLQTAVIHSGPPLNFFQFIDA